MNTFGASTKNGFLSTDIGILRTQCPEFINRHDYSNAPIVSTSCEVSTFKELGQIEDKKIYFLKYRWETLYDMTEPGKEKNIYTSKIDEAYILEGSIGKAAVHPIWSDTQDTEYFFIEGAEVFSIKDDRVMAIYYCVNGTGGCREDDFIRLSEKWVPLERDETWKIPHDRIPKGYRAGKSPFVDFKQMTWEESFFGENDPNCCHSKVIKSLS